jgi:hypothetical protein
MESKEMNTITHKKTFCMNFVLSFFFAFGLFMFFFVNIDYVEARLPEKIMNIFLFLAPVLTAITFYKNEQGFLLKLALILNIGISLMVALFTFRSLYHQSWDSVIFMLIWMVPFVINVKQLTLLKS